MSEVNRRPLISVDKENEIEKRRRELAKQKEVREKQTKDEVCLKTKGKSYRRTNICSRQRI